MTDDVNRLVERRQLMRAAIANLAEPLEGEARVRFLAAAEERLNRSLPAPGRAHMRNYLRAVVAD